MKRWLGRLVRFGYVPTMLLGFNAAACTLVANGASYWWLTALLVLALFTAFAAERLAPWHDAWNQAHDDTGTNVWHAVVYQLSTLVGVIVAAVLIGRFRFESSGVWPTNWPIPAQLALALACVDFAFMVVHHLSHRYELLWRLHVVHHSARRLYSFNGQVRHPLHLLLDMAVGTLPLLLLGMPLSVATVLGFSIALQLIVQHSNVAVALGPLENWLNIGRIHHMHHVKWGKEGDCNFGFITTIWDRVFGTFRPRPVRAIQADDLGVDGIPNFPSSYLEHLEFPFARRWAPAAPAAEDSRPRA